MKYPTVHTQNIERAWCEMHIHIAAEVLKKLKPPLLCPKMELG